MQLNVTSVFNCIQQFLPLLRNAGLASTAGADMTGNIIPLDGGFSL